MGSISYPIPARSSARQEAVKHVRQSGEVVASNCAPYDSDEWAGVYFAAHRTDEGRVWASITLFGQRSHHVFIKTMDESMVPTALGVGPRVLAALTDTTDANSLQWRADAARYRRRRTEAQAAQGKTITLGTPVTLTNGQSIDRVTVLDLTLWQHNTGMRIRPAGTGSWPAGARRHPNRPGRPERHSATMELLLSRQAASNDRTPNPQSDFPANDTQENNP